MPLFWWKATAEVRTVQLSLYIRRCLSQQNCSLREMRIQHSARWKEEEEYLGTSCEAQKKLKKNTATCLESKRNYRKNRWTRFHDNNLLRVFTRITVCALALRTLCLSIFTQTSLSRSETMIYDFYCFPNTLPIPSSYGNLNPFQDLDWSTATNCWNQARETPTLGKFSHLSVHLALNFPPPSFHLCLLFSLKYRPGQRAFLRTRVAKWYYQQRYLLSRPASKCLQSANWNGELLIGMDPQESRLMGPLVAAAAAAVQSLPVAAAAQPVEFAGQ